jgi:hypothetical protein
VSDEPERAEQSIASQRFAQATRRTTHPRNSFAYLPNSRARPARAMMCARQSER